MRACDGACAYLHYTLPLLPPQHILQQLFEVVEIVGEEDLENRSMLVCELTGLHTWPTAKCQNIGAHAMLRMNFVIPYYTDWFPKPNL